MKKSILSLAMLMLLTANFTSCKDNSKLENLEEQLENRSDDLEDASDDIGDVADDIEDALESFRDALKEVKNPEDKEEIRKRVNDIFDEMKVEIQN